MDSTLSTPTTVNPVCPRTSRTPWVRTLVATLRFAGVDRVRGRKRPPKRLRTLRFDSRSLEARRSRIKIASNGLSGVNGMTPYSGSWPGSGFGLDNARRTVPAQWSFQSWFRPRHSQPAAEWHYPPHPGCPETARRARRSRESRYRRKETKEK